MKQNKLTFAALAGCLLVGCAMNNDGTEQSKIVLDQEAPQPQHEQMKHAALVKEALYSTAKRSRSVGMIASMETAASPQLSYYAPNQDDAKENYATLQQSSVQQVSTQPVSTFSIDVDTGSYSNIRRMLNQGTLPPANAVRLEEMINYFSYHYDAPHEGETPFSIQTELATSPWSSQHTLLKIGLKGYEPSQTRPAANLVFLLDVSGSMNAANKLPLLKKSLLMLSKQLSEQDKVSIVVYAGASGLILEPTSGNQSLEIEQALERLSAGGSTNGQAGIHLAYQTAQKAFIEDGINRIILATDGDFNVGTSDVDSLKELIAQQRKKGISLTTLGFGSGNYNDHLMEQIADTGNGNYAYIDTLNEARKVLVETLDATLLTIAKDVKIQVEFNPEQVQEYRLLGYENRALKREDFNNDKVDAGEIGAGHTVTAIYELVLNDSSGAAVDPLRYKNKTTNKTPDLQPHSDELAFVKVRYKAPDSETSKLISKAVQKPVKAKSFSSASDDFRFSASVVHFGEVLRHSQYLPQTNFAQIIADAQKSKGEDPFGYRSEFIQLVRLAAAL